MQTHEIYQILTKATWAFFVFAFGGCVGSLINVIAYRLPLGLNIVTPPSRCPMCGTKLTWRENIPIFGWLILRGKCRFCKSKISAEYPIVEAFVACLFLLIYATWYFLPYDATWFGLNFGQFRPQWTQSDVYDIWPRYTWPTFLVVIALVGSLVAMTLVDAKTFTIPLELPWFATLVALVGHTLHAYGLQYYGVRLQPLTSGQVWYIPTPDPFPPHWGGVLGCVGGVVGIGVSVLLVRLGLIRRSFADYDEWEKKAIAEAQAAAPPAPASPATAESSVMAEAPTGVADGTGATGGGPEMWIQYPFARREVIKEVLFLTPCIVLGYIGWMLGSRMLSLPPLWVQVLGGVLLGYLVGGGVVWVVRIVGSFAFGKEAMGMGDVHLMGAVGAALGWIDATLAFFGAAFVGLAWNLGGAIFSGKISRTMPYGPYLAASTVLVLLLKPLICKLLLLLGIDIC